MKIETHYNRVERVVYTFDESDIYNALLAFGKIKGYEQGKQNLFEWDEDESGELTATVTVRHETKDATNE